MNIGCVVCPVLKERFSSGPKKCPPLFEYLYLRFELRYFESLFIEQLIIHCIVVGEVLSRFSLIMKIIETLNSTYVEMRLRKNSKLHSFDLLEQTD